MKKSIAKKWVKALRSGKYKKTEGVLKSSDGEYCCLGVLCDISKKGSWKGLGYATPNKTVFGVLPKDIRKWAGMKSSVGEFSKNPQNESETLIYLNDYVAKSFRKIANFIEKNWKDL